MILAKFYQKNSSKIYTKFWSVRPKELCYLGPTHRLTLNLRLKIFTKLHDSTVAKIQNFPAWGGGDILLSRAVASLTVPGGQEFHFPHFFPRILINLSYFS